MSTEAPRRHTLTDAYNDAQRIIEQLTTRSTEPYVSVEFTRNAKGETQISTKVGAPGGTHPDALAILTRDALAAAASTYDAATAKYPSASGFVRNDGDAGK
jgi:hypothetical protein